MELRIMSNEVGGDVAELRDADFRLAWVRLGEGIQGDYDPTNPEDEELLRLDAQCVEQGEEEILETYGSCCTFFPASATEEQKLAALKIMQAYYRRAMQAEGPSRFDRLTQIFSHIELSWLVDGIPANDKAALEESC